MTLLLDDYDANWNRLWWLRVDGRAAVVEGRLLQSDSEIRKVADALRAKYPQYSEVPLFRTDPQLWLVPTSCATGAWAWSTPQRQANSPKVLGSTEGFPPTISRRGASIWTSEWLAGVNGSSWP